LNEIAAGLKPETVYEKPEVLIYRDQMDRFGALPYDGGIMDQPYIFMLELGVAEQVSAMFNAINAANQAAKGGK
jgi:hypothetical protein